MADDADAYRGNPFWEAASNFPRTTGLAPRVRALIEAGATDEWIGHFIDGWVSSGAPVIGVSLGPIVAVDRRKIN